MPGIAKVQNLSFETLLVYRMKPGIGEILQPTPDLLKLIRKNPKFIDLRNRKPFTQLTLTDLWEVLSTRPHLWDVPHLTSYVIHG